MRLLRSRKEFARAPRHTYVDLDVSADPAHLEEFRRRLPRVKAVPQIFIAGEHIGGYDDLCLLDMSGELAEMLGAKENP